MLFLTFFFWVKETEINLYEVINILVMMMIMIIVAK